MDHLPPPVIRIVPPVTSIGDSGMRLRARLTIRATLALTAAVGALLAVSMKRRQTEFHVNLGDVQPGTTIVHEFVFRNWSGQQMQLQLGDTNSSPAFRETLSGHNLAPFEVGVLKMRCTVPNGAKEIRRGVVVYTDDEKRPSLRFQLVASVASSD